MRPPVLRILLTLAGSICLVALAWSAEVITKDVLLARPDLWPNQVKLIDPMTAPIVLEGKTVGSVELGAGTELPVKRVLSKTIELDCNGSPLTVAHEKTDLIDRFKQRASTEATLARARSTQTSTRPPLPAAKPEPKVPTGAVATELGDDLVQLDGKSLVDRDIKTLAGVKYYAVYFSAGWCGPCRAFTPNLVKFYKELKPDHPEFELIFLSRDQNAANMKNYMSDNEMPWPAVKFSRIDNKDSLNRLACNGIPCLVFLDPEGNVLSHSEVNGQYVGPQKVMRDIQTMLTAKN